MGRKERKKDPKVSFKSLGIVGKCKTCGKELDENLHYMTKFCDACHLERIREGRRKYRKLHKNDDIKRKRQEEVRQTERRKELLRQRREKLTKEIDPVVRKIDKGNGITVSVRGYCFGGGGCQHIPSYMSSWR